MNTKKASHIDLERHETYSKISFGTMKASAVNIHWKDVKVEVRKPSRW